MQPSIFSPASTTHACTLGSSASASKIIVFTRLEVDSDMKLEGNACPNEHKAPTSVDLNDNVSTLAPANCQRFPNTTGAQQSSEEQDNRADLNTLELPDISADVSTLGYSKIKQDGKERLRHILEAVEEAPLPSVPSLWSCWEAPSEIIEDKVVKEAGEEMKLAPVAGLFRMQCSWTELFRSGERFLYDDSCNLLKKMVRANAQLMMFKKDTTVPNVFGDGWVRSIYDIQLPESLTGCGGEFQQLLLPSDLVRDDEAELADAPAKFVSLADRNLRCLRRSDVSLTRASMNTPSVWNLKITAERVAGLVADKLPTLTPQLTPTSPTVQSSNTLPETTEVLKLRLNSPLDRRKSLLNTKIHSDDQGIAMLPDQPQTATAKLKVVAEDKPLSTDYFLSDKFLKCAWSEPPKEDNESGVKKGERLKDSQPLQQLARPAMWDLMRKKLLKVDGASFAHAFDGVNLETLQAIIHQQIPKVKQMSLNPSAFSSVEIIEVCTSLREAVWLHSLRILSIGMTGAQKGEMMSEILTRIHSSIKYKLALGSSNLKDLCTLNQTIDGRAVFSGEVIECPESSVVEENSMLQLPFKKQRVLPTTKEIVSVRAMCSIAFLEKDELLDELCTEQHIFFIERDLPPPIDMLVDERNSICIVNEDTFQGEESMRRFIFSLAHLQVQQQKCWIVIALSNPISAKTEGLLNLFLAALVQFRIGIKVLTSFSNEETGRFVRAIVDECAEVALNDYRILPRLWFERPFLLEEESQLERFLVSTKVVNHYAAQSLLQKICVDDLFSKSLEELKLLVQNAVTDKQLELLWRLVQQNHGLNQTNYYSTS